MEGNRKQWGGSRQGSGRKRTAVKTVCIRVPEDVAAILDGVTGSKTDYIVEAIRYYATSRKIAEKLLVNSDI